MSEPIVFLPLSQGQVAIIDFADFEKVGRFKWTAQKRPNNNFYVQRRIELPKVNGKRKRKIVYLHRSILDAPPGVGVDHEDSDGLNNTRLNIRLATATQNNWNLGKRKNSRSQFKGVSKNGKNWAVKICVFGKQHSLGTFEDEKQAARVYDDAAEICFGKFARLNFP